MTIVVVGSVATARWREVAPVDLDIVGTYDELSRFFRMSREHTVVRVSDTAIIAKHADGRMAEARIAWEGTTDYELVQRHPDFELRWNDTDFDFATLNEQLALKLSHRYLRNSPHFLKTMRDIRALRKAGAVVTEDLKGFLKRREKETYTYTHPKLNTNKRDFFDTPGVQYRYDHDSIHRAVKHLEVPAYEFAKPKNSEVLCSKKMFEELSWQTQLLMGLEEAYVLALERSLVPFPGVLTPEQAFTKALEKVCTSITSGWFREFCWENYHDIKAMYSDAYVDKFQAGIANGTVKEIK